MPNPLSDLELQQARDQSWNPAVRRLLDWYAATVNTPIGVQAAAPAPEPVPAAAPAPALPVPTISLGELRKLAGLTVAQLAGLVRLAPERVSDIESLDLELLDVDQLLTYTTALGMALTVTVDLMPGAPRELISTRGKVTELQREQAIASLRAGGQQTLETESTLGLRQSPTEAASLAELGEQVDADPAGDTQPPAAGELPSVIDAEPEEPDPAPKFATHGAPDIGRPYDVIGAPKRLG